MVQIIVIILMLQILASTSGIDNNWAVIVCSSRYWFNYRHLTNALSIYATIRSYGIPDSQIILMNALSQAPCDPRNDRPGTIVDTPSVDNNTRNLYENVEVDYFGLDVNVENFINLMTGRHPRGTPLSKKLATDENSRILIFLSGHGGDEFLKFHDQEEISAQDVGYTFSEMRLKKRYKEVLLLIETCQASTLANYITAPRITTIASSAKGQNSYSYYSNDDLGVSIIDRFAFAAQQFFASNNFHDILKNDRTSKMSLKQTRNEKKRKVRAKSRGKTVQHFVDALDPRFLRSTAVLISSPQSRLPADMSLMDFFSGSFPISVTTVSDNYDLYRNLLFRSSRQQNVYNHSADLSAVSSPIEKVSDAGDKDSADSSSCANPIPPDEGGRALFDSVPNLSRSHHTDSFDSTEPVEVERFLANLLVEVDEVYEALQAEMGEWDALSKEAEVS